MNTRLLLVSTMLISSGLITTLAGCTTMSAGNVATRDVATCDTTAESVQYMRDVIAIQQLLGRYAFALDSRDGAGWAATFVEEGEFETVGAQRMVGRAAIAAALSAARPPFATRHFAHNTVIDVKGDTATMRAYLMVLRGDKVVVTGNYSDTLRRVNGQWLFVKRTFTRDAVPAQ